MVLQGLTQFVADNLIFIDFLAILMMKCKHYLTTFARFNTIFQTLSPPQRGDMSIEKGIVTSCTPAECYV